MKQKIKELDSRVGKLKGDVSEIIGKMDYYFSYLGNIVKKTNEAQQEIFNHIGLVKDGIDSELSFLRHSFNEVKADFSCAKHQVLALKSEFDKSITKILDLENSIKCQSNMIQSLTRERKHVKEKTFGENKKLSVDLNIVVHGIKEISESAETWFRNFCKSYLGTEAEIERASFKKTKKGFWIAIIAMKSKKEKGKIFKQCHKLKNANLGLSITDDKQNGNYRGAGLAGMSNKKQTMEIMTSTTRSADVYHPPARKMTSVKLKRKIKIAEIAPSYYNQQQKTDNASNELIKPSSYHNQQYSKTLSEREIASSSHPSSVMSSPSPSLQLKNREKKTANSSSSASWTQPSSCSEKEEDLTSTILPKINYLKQDERTCQPVFNTKMKNNSSNQERTMQRGTQGGGGCLKTNNDYLNQGPVGSQSEQKQ